MYILHIALIKPAQYTYLIPETKIRVRCAKLAFKTSSFRFQLSKTVSNDRVRKSCCDISRGAAGRGSVACAYRSPTHFTWILCTRGTQLSERRFRHVHPATAAPPSTQFRVRWTSRGDGETAGGREMQVGQNGRVATRDDSQVNYVRSNSDTRYRLRGLCLSSRS